MNLDISEAQHGELMRRSPPEATEDEVPNQKPEATSSSTDDLKMKHEAHHNSPQSDVDALLERISEGLIEDEEDEEELSAADLDAMLDRAVVAKRRRPPPPPPPPPKIDCQWGKWGKWSACTADCGGGTKDRARGERVPAANGGLACDGEAEEEKNCNKQPCSPPPPPPTAPPAVTTTPPPMMAKGGAKRMVSLTPAVLSLVLLTSYLSLRSFQ
jgi:hypothetical protein